MSASVEAARVALVTGGAAGIGKATVERLARAGRRTVVVDRDPAGAELAASLSRACPGVTFLQLDVTDSAAVQAAVRETHDRYGRLDILVCCAGTLGWERPFPEQTLEQFRHVMAVNVEAVYNFHQAVMPLMLAGGWGRCVTITSGARKGNPNQVPYSVSKAAVYALVQSLGRAYPEKGVFVNGVEPGRVLTQMVIPRFSSEFLAHPPVPIGRYADAEEIAEVIEFLCSERNSYTSGAVWEVKGGAV